MAPASPLKRGLEDDGQQASSPRTCLPNPPTHRDFTASTVRGSSPALSTSTALSSAPPSLAGSSAAKQSASMDLSGPPKKKRKLTPEEKEQRLKEQSARAQLKLEKRAQKEAEDAVKAEKRRQENEIKEEKQRVKDLAKRQKEEDEAKKQRAQLRLGSFFIKATSVKAETSSSPDKHRPGPASSAGQEGVDVTAPTSPSGSPSHVMASKTRPNDYETYFLPFALPSHATLATPYSVSASNAQRPHRFSMDNLASACSPVDSIRTILGLTVSTRRGRRQPRAAFVVERLSGSQTKPVDLCGDTASHSPTTATEELAEIDIKHLHFGEDVRPPYVGSYTRRISPKNAVKAARNPVYRVRPDTNYDYDSEAEWEEPEEGEDLLSDGEEDAESIGSVDEMAGFVDEVVDDRRRIVASEMEPVSTGICWETPDGVGCKTTNAAQTEFGLFDMRLEWLLGSKVDSIDPLSAAYWKVEEIAEPMAAAPAHTDLFGRSVNAAVTPTKTEMKPPRMPLQPATTALNTKIIVNAKSGEKGPIMAIATAKVPKPAAQPLQGAAFEEFKEAVDGSNLNKADLLKALKQRFPKFTNNAIQETLTQNFARNGGTAGDRRWKLLST